MVLTDTCLEDLVEPVGIGIVHKPVDTILTLGVSAWNRRVRVLTSDTEILAVLIGIHHVIDVLRNTIDTEVTLVVELERLVFLTILGCDDNDTVGSTRTVDCTCRCILQYLDSLNVVWREVADRSTHWHTIDNVERGSRTETADTTNTNRRIGTWLTVRSNLNTGNLTFEHCRDIRI